MPVTKTNINVRIFVDDISTILLSYDQIEVFRSTGDTSGPWEPVAASSGPAAASITGDRTEPFHLSGLTLVLELNGLTQSTVTFSGADPYMGADVVSDINAVLGVSGTASLVDGAVKIETASTGTGASIEVVGGTGYANLGFQLETCGLGVDAPVSLVSGQHDYLCVDRNGDTSYWYKTRYRNSGTGDVSEYSAPFPAISVRKLPSTDLITGTCHLVDMSGNALRGQRIHVYNVFEPSTRSGYAIFGMDEVTETDENGFASLVLVRGSLVEVAWVGTSVRRRIRVPSDPSLETFDLLDPSLADDEFGIQVPTIRLAERRSP